MRAEASGRSWDPRMWNPSPATGKGCVSPETGSQRVLPGARRQQQGLDPTEPGAGHRIWSASESKGGSLGGCTGSRIKNLG